MASTVDDSIFSKLEEGRRHFLALVDDVRPDLHRYCARMLLQDIRAFFAKLKG